MSGLDDFIRCLQCYLVGDNNGNHNIIRTHTRKLEQLADVSFPFHVKSWKRVLKSNETCPVEDILSLKSERLEVSGEQELLNNSKIWPLQIHKCTKINSHYHIFLERVPAFERGIKEIMTSRDRYGFSKLNITHNIKFERDSFDEDASSINLSELRLLKIKSVTERLLSCMEYFKDCTEDLHILFSLKSNCKSDINRKIIFCGPVLSDEEMKKSVSTASEFLKKRTVDMRLMAEHKYGLRITSQPGWQEFFEKLGEAAVVIELLQNKPSHSTVISLVDNTVTSIKGASFILYNCARLAKLHKEFEKRVKTNAYPPLPTLENIDFGLLTQPEEWELFFVYVLQFPQTIKNCLWDIENGRVNPHYIVTMLSNLCNVFSMYYRRVKILTEPRDHMFAVIHARIYLLKAIEQVLHNSLKILNIEPVKQM